MRSLDDAADTISIYRIDSFDVLSFSIQKPFSTIISDWILLLPNLNSKISINIRLEGNFVVLFSWWCGNRSFLRPKTNDDELWFSRPTKLELHFGFDFCLIWPVILWLVHSQNNNAKSLCKNTNDKNVWCTKSLIQRLSNDQLSNLNYDKWIKFLLTTFDVDVFLKITEAVFRTRDIFDAIQ